VTTHGTWGKITAGTGGTTDNAGFQFNGSGEYRSAWNDKLTLRSGKADIVVRDPMGKGGRLRAESINPTLGPLYSAGAEVPLDVTITSADGVNAFCTGCKGDAHGRGFLMLEPETDLRAARVSCSSTAGGCNSTSGAVGDTGYVDQASGSITDYGNGNNKGKFEFVQQLRNADGSGGWVVGFTQGNGYVEGIDAYHNKIEDSGDGGGTYLGYMEADGYNEGQACASSRCVGSAPVGDRLKWVNPDEKVTGALGLYRDEFCKCGSDTLLARAGAVAAYGGAQSHTRWMSDIGNTQLQPLAQAAEAAQRDGTVTKAERDALAQELAKNPKILERAQRTHGAVDTIFNRAGRRMRSASSARTPHCSRRSPAGTGTRIPPRRTGSSRMRRN
jgi:hypothetical protein